MKTTKHLSYAKQLIQLLLLVLSSLLWSISNVWSLESTSPASLVSSNTAKDVATSIVRAYGGPEKLKETKAQAFLSKGKVTVTSAISLASNSFECDIFGKADKLRIETTVIGQPMVLAFDGKNCWTQFGDWVSPSTETTAKHIAEELRHGLNLLLKISDPNCNLKLVGKKLCQGKMCDVLSVLAEDSKTTTLYADEITHLVLRSEYMGTDYERAVPALQVMEYEDYQLVAGTPTAFKTTEYSNLKKTSETLLTKMQLGVSLDENIFEMPAESEVARVKESPVTVPFEYTGNVIVIKVRINGTTDCKFIVDTGASQTVIDKAVATSLGPYSSSSFSITAGSKAIPLSYTTLQSLSIGDVTLTSVPALVSDLSAFVKTIGERPAGLIGANILRRFLVTIDFGDKKVVLSDPKKPTIPQKATVVPTFPGFGSTALVVTGKLDNKVALNFLVDTGATFNNLPQSTIRPLYRGPILPVGKIFGIDGQPMNIGSIKFDTLKLGSLSIHNPVFMLSPDSSSSGSVGLFSAASMGILGNPVWSQFHMTIDYRNERLILEELPNTAHRQSILDQLDSTKLGLLQRKDIQQALRCYETIALASRQAGYRAGEALALAGQASCYSARFSQSKDKSWLTKSSQLYEKAWSLAKESYDKTAQGRVLSQWASFYLTCGNSPAEIAYAQNLLSRAIELAPTDPSICAELGNACQKAGIVSIADKLIDQALLLDPASWTGLWAKYQIFQRQGNTPGQQKVRALLKHYYPTNPEVLGLGKAANPAPQRTSGKPRAALSRHR